MMIANFSIFAGMAEMKAVMYVVSIEDVAITESGRGGSS
jgi:hypothetical protein